MVLLKTSMAKGFTLIEIIVTIAILGMILVLGLVVSMDSYKGEIFRTERAVLVSQLSRVRSLSMGNIGEVRHGICYDNTDLLSPKYIIFEGNSYATAVNEVDVEAKTAVSLTPPTSVFFCNVGPGVVFDQLSGRLYPSVLPSSGELVIIITEDGRTSNISINNEGTINW